MLVAAALVPHPPLLLPAVGGKHAARLKQTQRAYTELERSLYAAKPDVIITLSPHQPQLSDAFTLNFASRYSVALKEFGQLKPQGDFRGSVALTGQFKEALETDDHYTLRVVSWPNLDYGSGIPLLLLTPKMPGISILPFYCHPNRDVPAHVEWAQKLADIIALTNRRIAVLASADLIRDNIAASEFTAPNKHVEQLNRALLKSLAHVDVELLQTVAQKLADDSTMHCCGLKPLAVLEGMLAHISANAELLSYEHPLGTGYALMQFTLP